VFRSSTSKILKVFKFFKRALYFEIFFLSIFCGHYCKVSCLPVFNFFFLTFFKERWEEHMNWWGGVWSAHLPGRNQFPGYPGSGCVIGNTIPNILTGISN
jgi:hypothetical protein